VARCLLRLNPFVLETLRLCAFASPLASLWDALRPVERLPEAHQDRRQDEIADAFVASSRLDRGGSAGSCLYWRSGHPRADFPDAGPCAGTRVISNAHVLVFPLLACPRLARFDPGRAGHRFGRLAGNVGPFPQVAIGEEYRSANYEIASNRVDIRLEVAFGSVKKG
jgi:hypothetical protein